MNVSSPSYPAVASASSGGGADQDMADAGGGIGSMFGSFMKGQADQAGGWSKIRGFGEARSDSRNRS